MSDKENENMEQSPQRSEKERMKLRKKYKDILNEFAQEETQHGTQQEEEAIKNAMDKADNLFSMIDTPQEACLDARVFRHLSRICRQHAESLSTSSQTFLPIEFAEKLGDNLNAPYDEDNGNLKLDLNHWIALGEQSSDVFRWSPYLTYLYGSLDPSEVEVKEKQKPRRSTAAERLADATKALILGQDDEEEEEGKDKNKKTLTEILVESTFHQLVREFKKNGKQPISYFRFVINPENFGKSVENMFHVSFLVKENQAQIFVEENDGLPRILPVRKSKPSDNLEDKKQVVVSLSIPQWQALKTKLAITRSQISHEDILAH